MARKQFGGWKSQADPFVAHPVPQVPPLDSTRGIVVTSDVPDITLELMWQGPSVRKDAAATYDADVLSDLLNDEESNFQKHLVDRGYFQSIQVGYQTLDHVGPITILGTTTVKQFSDALAVLSGELMLMRSDDYFDQHLLEKIKKRRSVAQAFELEAGAGLAQMLGYTWAVSGLEYYLGYVDNMSARSVDNLRGFVDRYLIDKPYVIGVLTNPASTKEVSGFLQQFVAYTQGEK
jgi:zinc protease